MNLEAAAALIAFFFFATVILKFVALFEHKNGAL